MKKLSFFIFNCLFTFLAQANEIPESEPLKVHSTLSLNQIDSARTSPTKNQKLWLTANIAKLLPSFTVTIGAWYKVVDYFISPNDYEENIRFEMLGFLTLKSVACINSLVNVIMDYKSSNQTRSLKKEKILLAKDSIITVLSFIIDIEMAYFCKQPNFDHFLIYHFPFILLTAFSGWDAFKRVKIITEKPKNIPLKLDLPSVRVKNL